MKKLFTLLILLAAFFAIPRSAQAVVWEVSDGTVQRINPNNPSDPNDLVTIPAGVEFCRIMCAYQDGHTYYVNSVVNYYDVHLWVSYASSYYIDINSYTLRRTRLSSPNNINFPDVALAYRLVERVLGYNYYSNNKSIKWKYENRNNIIDYYVDDYDYGKQLTDYYSKCIITKDEALSIKTLNLNPVDLGLIDPGWLDYRSIYSIKGLEIFENLENLYLQNNNHLGQNPYFAANYYFYTPIFTSFNKLKVLDLSNTGPFCDTSPFKADPEDLSPFPTSLNTLILRNTSTVDFINLKNHPNIKTIDLKGSDVQLLNVDNCPELDALLVTDCPMLRVLNCQSDNLEELDLTGCKSLQQLYCNNNMLETLTFGSNTTYNNLYRIECQDNNLTSVSFNNTNNIRSLQYLNCSKNNLTTLDLPNATALEELYCWNNKLTSLDLSACSNLWRLRMSNNKVPSLNLTNNRKLKEIYANNNLLTTLDCSNLTYLQEAQLSRNKMTSLDMSGCSSVKTLLCNGQGGDNVRLLDTLNLTGCTALTTLECQNNALTSLDISTCTGLVPSGIKAYIQRSEKDVVVIDRDKVCIELVNGVTPAIANNGTISDTHMDNYFGTWTGSGFDKERNKVIKRNGKTYLVIHDISDAARGGAQTKADVDLYGKQMKYQYALSPDNWNETLGGSLANSKKNDNVTVTTYPYVMYVNPISKDIHSEEVTQQGKEPFYSGTIYLDYDAIVPAGATAYIAKRIKINQDLIYSTAGGGHQKVTADQLQLVPLVAGEGASEVVIPAYTPVYVKSATEFGLFSFDRNNHGGIEQALGYAQDGSHLTRDNILKGVLTDSAITKYSVLSLGRGRPKGSDDNGYSTESRIGFWPFSGTTIPAHRVFIPISELENAGGSSSSPGLLFSFTDDINENNTTDIRTAVINKAEGWYTINGIRLNGRPKEKGIYIHNGRKEVIR